MEPNQSGREEGRAAPSLAALWHEAAEVVQEAVVEAEAAIDFIGSTLNSLRPLLERVHTLEEQLRQAPAVMGAAGPRPEAAPPTPEPGAAAAAPPEGVAPAGAPMGAGPAEEPPKLRYTLTLETGETRADFPQLYHRLDEALGGADMALVSYLGGVAVITVEGRDLRPGVLEAAVTRGLGADAGLEWEDGQHVRVRLS